jgi:hypothetical protein
MIGSYGDEAENGHPTELSMLKLPKNVNGGILSRQGYTECTKTILCLTTATDSVTWLR